MAEVEVQYTAELIDGPMQIAIHTRNATHWHLIDSAGQWVEIEKNDGAGHVTFEIRGDPRIYLAPPEHEQDDDDG